MFPLSEYRFFDTSTQSASYPGIGKDFQRTFATLRALRCDLFLGAHGIHFDLLSKEKRMQTDGEAASVDPKDHVHIVDQAQATFDKAVAAQRVKQQADAKDRRQ